jgi:aspartate carbamoyltransferase catalytic subunit
VERAGSQDEALEEADAVVMLRIRRERVVGQASAGSLGLDGP